MARLENILPPLELCKQIPDGAFEDSALVWITDFSGGERIAEPRRYAPYDHIAAPAPTLVEIMCEIAKYPHYFNNAWLEVDGDGFIAGAWLPNRGKPGAHFTEYRDRNPATAALKLWLELTGEDEHGR